MKVLHIIDSLGLGGAQTLVQGIFEHQKENTDIFLFALRKKNIKIDIIHSNVKTCDSDKKYSFKSLFELRELIQKENIDILHCHLFKAQMFGWLLKKLWFKNIKLIFHEHGEIFQKHFLYNLFMKKSQNLVDCFIAVSEVTKFELIKKGIWENKIKVLYNFVDLEKFNRKNITWDIEVEKEKLGIKKNEFVIGFVGRLEKVKGCEYLIKALPYLNFPFKVLIAGDGSERKHLEKLARDLKVSEKVMFLGYRSDTVFLYSLMNIFVMPSLFESFGLSVLEAQSMGVLTVFSDISGLNEVALKYGSGFLFKTKDYFSLAQIVVKLKNQTGQKQLSLNVESIMNKKYSFYSFMNDLKKNYE